MQAKGKRGQMKLGGRESVSCHESDFQLTGQIPAASMTDIGNIKRPHTKNDDVI